MEQQTNWARSERIALADLMTNLGPTAPTLCVGWTAQDLAAHIVVRERRPDAAAGIVFSPLSNYCEKIRQEFKHRPWADLLQMIRTGPPQWNPMGWAGVESAANLFEFFVHHEDVLRAQEAWQPRVINEQLSNQIMNRLRNSAWLMWRRARVGVILTDGTTSIVAKRPPINTGIVTVTGEPAELLLTTYGRSKTLVKVTGAEKDIEVFHTTNLSF